MKDPIKVLIVDDSALIRQLLSTILDQDKDIKVVGTAVDPYQAREKIKQLNPDVLTLDVEMPKMDGITFLKNLMRLRPMPVVMISSLTTTGAEVTFNALELGAIDFIPKPKVGVAQDLALLTEDIVSKVKSAAQSKVRALPSTPPNVPKENNADCVLPKTQGPISFSTTDRLVAIGASTGGTEAIKEVLIALPADSPAILITQHIPEAFSKPFANRMDSCCAMKVYQAEDGQPILPGHVYISPGDQHLMVERNGARFLCRLNQGPPVSRHRPSVDVLFRSVAQQLGHNAMGILLTGMGKDGAQGLLELKENGSKTIAQDEATSVVWGMPGEAVKLGAAQRTCPLELVASAIINFHRNVS
ncbi:chemotaxis response regulator protein-glutamate methylesterase [Motiliproteus sp. MSK22-1]|uniref:protein-glutamate methylesterase/protein-glutamine glutaminase n=1 Tax=Motiliproteus sp. MSK22-1 TaxID=1897630 RepID=UPI0009768702|nr:chemotaxis response regulator protein-glutamate methylesterase [Motiliproteus sp. MSK22-1]OMH32137.1 chemotaxis response regulator protein-glutamate methylesterase [Motiliproteus sp. MSK22-1]